MTVSYNGGNKVPFQSDNKKKRSEMSGLVKPEIIMKDRGAVFC